MGHFFSSLLIFCVKAAITIAAIVGIIGFTIMTWDVSKAAKDEIKHEQELKQIRKEIFGDSDD